MKIAEPPDPFNLERFASAQATLYDTALAELTAGKKRSHWMWFIFPQMRGLGHSSMAELYAIASLEEAKAYLAHSLLVRRLYTCTEAVLASTVSVRTLLGAPDDRKFLSSMTLFAEAAGSTASVFRQALAGKCNGEKDVRTLALIGL